MRCADTRLGFHVRVVGSCGPLGKWTPNMGLPMQTSAAEFPLWSAAATNLDEDDLIEYKYVICDNSGRPERWEERPNRAMSLSKLAECNVCPGKERVMVIETFNMGDEPDAKRFQNAVTGMGTTASVRGVSGSGRISSKCGLSEMAQAGEGGAEAGEDLFAPTIRERSSSMSLLSGVPTAQGPLTTGMRRTSFGNSQGLLAGVDAHEEEPGDNEPSSAKGGQPAASGLQGMAREESCSNLFLGTEEEEEDFAHLPEFEDQYALVGNGPLGEGTFGLVWRCSPKSAIAAGAQEHRAAKIVRKARLQPRDMRHLLGDEGEVKTHLKMKHPNIITLYQYFDEPLTVTLVLEYCEGGDLFDAIVREGRASRRGLQESASRRVMQHLLSALTYVHERRVVHRDIKCENILLQRCGVPHEQNVFKLCDFGFAATDKGDGFQDRLGSPDTVAPEVVVGQRYSTPADIWSSGVLLYMMLTATPPFYAPTDSEVLRRVRTGNYQLTDRVWESISAECKTLLRSLMTVDAAKRPTAPQALNMEWLTKTN